MESWVHAQIGPAMGTPLFICKRATRNPLHKKSYLMCVKKDRKGTLFFKIKKMEMAESRELLADLTMLKCRRIFRYKQIDTFKDTFKDTVNKWAPGEARASTTDAARYIQAYRHTASNTVHSEG